MALGLLQDHFGVPGQPLGMVDVMGSGGLLGVACGCGIHGPWAAARPLWGAC